MIAKKEWFKPRIFGWGLRPVTWEGWIYIVIAVLLIIGAINLPIPQLYGVIIASVLMVVFLIDSLIVMFQIYASLDEREKKYQQIIETSVSYMALVAIIAVLLYRSFIDNVVDIPLLIVLIVMGLTKTFVSVYLLKKG
jgi:hypothetical protein